MELLVDCVHLKDIQRQSELQTQITERAGPDKGTQFLRDALRDEAGVVYKWQIFMFHMLLGSQKEHGTIVPWRKWPLNFPQATSDEHPRS